MKIISVLIVILILVVTLSILACCKVASESDERIEKEKEENK